jgi:hypothetical protein
MNPKGLAVVGVIAVVALAFAMWQVATGQDKAKAKPEPAVVIPEAKDVTEIRCIGNGLFPDGPFDKKKKFDLKFTKQEQVEPVLGWLKTIEWDKAEDIKQLRVVADLIIVGEMVITTKDKKTVRFELQPDRIIEGNNRWAADVKKLDMILKAGQ